MAPTPSRLLNQAGATSDSDSRIRVGVPWPPTQPHRSKLLCRCANDHDEACGHRHSDVVVLGVNHPPKEYIMLDSIVTNIDLVIVLIVLFLVVPLITGLCIKAGQGEDE